MLCRSRLVASTALLIFLKGCDATKMWLKFVFTRSFQFDLDTLCTCFRTDCFVNLSHYNSGSANRLSLKMGQLTTIFDQKDNLQCTTALYLILTCEVGIYNEVLKAQLHREISLKRQKEDRK